MSSQNKAVADGSGNVYISDALNGRVLKETLSNGGYSESVIYTCGIVGVQSCPSAVAVDVGGKLYITAYDSSQVLVLTPSNGGYSQSSIGSGLNWPSDIVVDGNGNLYIADTLNNRIVKETASGDQYIQSTIVSGPSSWGLAVDSIGNVYVADTSGGQYLREDYSNPPSLNFTAASNSSQTVTLANAGNAVLSFPVPGSGENPSISSEFTLDSSAVSACPVVTAGSSSSATLASGASCTLTVSPAGAGTFQGSLVLTDTNLNAVAPGYATQTIALDAAISSQIRLTVSPAKVLVGQPVTLTATVIVPSGGATPTGQVTFSGAGTPAPVATLSGSGVATVSTSTLPIGGYSVTATYSGDTNYLGGNSNPAAFAVTGYASQTAVNASATQLQAGQVPTLTATVTGATGSATPTGNVTFSGVGSTSPSVALNSSGVASWTPSTLNVGNYSVTASYPGDATHNPSQSPPVYFSVAAGPPANVIAASGANSSGQYGHGINLCAQVTDANSNPLAGIPVAFNGTGLTFLPSPASSNTSGQACTAALPLTLGSLTATASVIGVSATATFNLTASAAPLTVKLHGNWRYYGAANPGPDVTANGLVNGDTLGGTVVVTASTTAPPASPVGDYPWSSPALGGSSAANYTATFVDTAQLRVRPKLLAVYPRVIGSTYGQTPALPTEFLFRGFVNGDSASIVSGAPVMSTAVTSSSPAGYYKIDIEVGTLSAPNYTFIAWTGQYQVYRAPITLTANSVTMAQGSAVPPLTYTLTGFVNGDTASAVTGVPLLTTTATSTSPPGTYPIVVYKENMLAANYAVVKNENGGVVTVTP